MKKIITAFLTVIAVTAFAQSSKIELPLNKPVTLNEPAEYKGLVITVTKIEFVDRLEAEGEKPLVNEDSDATFCRIFYTIKNGTKAPIDVSPKRNFSLKDDKNNSFNPPDDFKSWCFMDVITNLSPGLSKKGSTFFLIPKETKNVTVLYGR